MKKKIDLAFRPGAQPEATLPSMLDHTAGKEGRPVVDKYTDEGFPRLQPPPAPEEVPQELHDIFQELCRCCGEYIHRCRRNSPPAQRRPQLLGPTPRPATTPKTLQRGKSNADQTRQRNKMEGTGAGALGVSAAATTTLSEDPYLPAGGDGMMLPDTQGNGTLQHLGQDQQLYSDTPRTPHHVELDKQNDVFDSRPETPSTERVANILANGPIHALGNAATQLLDPNTTAIMEINGADRNAGKSMQPTHNHGDDVDSWEIVGDQTLDSPNAQGFAKLVFTDGDYIVTTHDVELGRNMEIAGLYRKEVKEKKREQRRERVPPAQKELAQRELEMYQQEPSQPSLPGDEAQNANASHSSGSLEGRPAAQGTFSESGGALAFAADSDDEAERRRGRKKRRSLQYSKSSTSTTSVVPANLHPPMTAEYSQKDLFTEDGEPYSRTLATLPIHTPQREDITKISKKHLQFSFNFPDECWELSVLGNGAFVNEQLFNRGATIPLSHNDEIQIHSVTIVFKLPDSHRSSPGLSRGTFSQLEFEDDDLSVTQDAVETSPVRRLSNAFEDAASSEEETENVKRSKHKIKIGVKKSQKDKKAAGARQKSRQDEKTAPKISIKKQRRRSNESPSPDADKKAGKGKKPKEPAKQPAEAQVVESIEEAPAPTPFAPEPGSALASIPVDELPAKRKGPGRPPKNGLVSKRDQALVKKKEREYEKSGLAAPPFNHLLDMVRRETKQKEMLAKMQNGTLPPGTEVPPAVETDLEAAAVKAPSVPIPVKNGEQAGDVPSEATRRPSSPRPKRIARSPSPMKPESAYTEEEMKKPSATYVHILDEILRDHPTGQADLQEIYDRIMKRNPHFKYKATTNGWQSSVRHNLLSANRFKETGRSGKGKLWTIDYDIPLEREKKKKPTPPPRPTPMMNGQYPAYGQQTYGNAYGPPPNGQRPVNGGPGYYSPYGNGQPGQHPAGQNLPNRQDATPTGHPQPAQQSDPFGGLVPDILAVRSAFLEPYANDANIQAKSEWISKCVMVFSNRFHGSTEETELTVEAPDEKKAFADLDAVFKKYEALKVKQQQEQQAAGSATSVQPSTAAPMQGNGQSAPSANHSAPPQQQEQTVQTAVADGVAYQSANGGLNPTTSHVAAAPGSSQSGPAPMHGHSFGPAGGAFAGGSASPNVQGPPAPPASQSVPAALPTSTTAMAYAPPPQSVPSGTRASAYQSTPVGQPPTSQGSQPSPIQALPGPTQYAPQNGTKAYGSPAPVQHHPTVTPTPAQQSSASPAVQAPGDRPAQPTPHVQTTVAGPPPPAIEPLTPGAGTKRTAEDDNAEENEAKRVRAE